MRITRTASPTRRFGGGLLAAAAAVFVALLAPAVSAQWQVFALIERPPVTKQTVSMMERVVGLDPDQMELVDGFLTEAAAEFQRISEIMQTIRDDAQEESQENSDRTVWVDFFAKAEEFLGYREQIVEGFMANAELVVLPDQQTAWERFERRHFRSNTFGEAAAQFGSVAGVTVDIEGVVEDAELPDEAMTMVRPTLDQYASDVDRDLRSLVDAVDENSKARIEAMRKMADGEGWDMELMQKGMDRISELVESVRGTNMRYERQITAALDTETRLRFQRAFNKAAFPSIYKSDAAAGRFSAALQHEDLTEDQRQILTDLQAQYQREADAIRLRLRQEALEDNPVENMNRGWWNGQEEDENDDEEALEELSKRYIDQINNILTPEQREDLGAGDPGNWRNRSFEPR